MTGNLIIIAIHFAKGVTPTCGELYSGDRWAASGHAKQSETSEFDRKSKDTLSVSENILAFSHTVVT